MVAASLPFSRGDSPASRHVPPAAAAAASATRCASTPRAATRTTATRRRARRRRIGPRRCRPAGPSRCAGGREPREITRVEGEVSTCGARKRTNEQKRSTPREEPGRARRRRAEGWLDGSPRHQQPRHRRPARARARLRAPARGGERGATRDLDRARGIGASEPRARPTRRPAGSATSIARRERRPWRAPRCVAFARKKSDTTAVALRAPRDDGRTTGVARPLESSSRTQPRVRDDRRGRVRLARNAPSPSRLARAASRAERCLPAGSRRSTLRPASPSTSIRRPVSEGSDWFACSRDEGFS